MIWIALSEKDTYDAALEQRLSDAAEQFRADCGLPSRIVRLLTEVIEPYHGRILDPAYGSGGMFVSHARFVTGHGQNHGAEVPIRGAEETDETGCLCRLNLAELDGDIRHGDNDNIQACSYAHLFR